MQKKMKFNGTHMKQVSIFWKNDTPDGYGVTIFAKDNPNLEEYLKQMREAADKDYTKAAAKGEARCLLWAARDHLNSYSKLPRDKRTDEWPLIYGSLYLLEVYDPKQTLWRSDDFNGLITFYEL